MSESTRWPEGFTVVERAEIGSTNGEACRLAGEGAGDGTVVWALRQSAGRGRRGRRWESPAGNLYFSAVLRPDVDMATGAQLSFVAAVAIGDAVVAALPDGAAVAHKWPNDVLVGGAKISGILLESSGGAGRVIDWVVIGCGVNVTDAPVGVEAAATSLHAEGAVGTDARTLLGLVLERLRHWYEIWQRDGFGPVRGAWLARACGLGQAMTARLPGREMRGRFAGMDETGALLLELPDGRCHRVTAGEVYYDEG